MKNLLHLDFVERDQKANSIVISGVEEIDGEKITKVAVEILKTVDPEIGKDRLCLSIGWKIR